MYKVLSYVTARTHGETMVVSSENKSIPQGEEHMNLPKEVAQVYSLWERIAHGSSEWLQDMDGELAYVAGGGEPLVYGNENSKIWQAMMRAAEQNEGMIAIAGITFALADLALMGDFYRYIHSAVSNEEAVSLHCIDERLVDDLNNVSAQVHEHCGACAATQASIEPWIEPGQTVEDLLLAELGGDAKQKIYDEMPNHVSLAILVDFHGDEAVVNEEKRAELRAAGALAFQVSLPVLRIEAFIRESALDDATADRLMNVLVQWNVQIARNIIGGDHNDLQAFADHALIIMDKRSVEDHPLVTALYEHIQTVPHGKELFVRE